MKGNSVGAPPLLVYTAHSKHQFFAREIISAYTLVFGAVPLNPFMNFGYFLGDQVDRGLIREANNALVARADETWVFGPVSNGVFHEVLLAQRLGRPVRYFTLGRDIDSIEAATLMSAPIEDELCREHGDTAQVRHLLSRGSS